MTLAVVVFAPAISKHKQKTHFTIVIYYKLCCRLILGFETPMN